jgi:hypothetical protein
LEKIHDWLGKEYNNQNVGFLHFLHFGYMVKTKIRRLILLATTWGILRMMNNIILRGEVANFQFKAWLIVLKLFLDFGY